MSDGIDAVRRIVEGWPDMSVQDWREVCTDDVRYQNMPWDRTVTVGPDEVHRMLEGFAGRFEVGLEVHHLGVDGNAAFSERTEHFVPRPGVDGETFDLPVTGVFELRDGKVSAWRDYFDRRAMKS
jgi:limonene-1,2-epoxide hydrolase